MLNRICEEMRIALDELLAVSGLKAGDILVVGCSTSEVQGHKIGSGSSMEVAEALMRAIYHTITKQGIYLAVQCCEHLNRSIVIEQACAEKYMLEEVMAIPSQNAGGAFATTAYCTFRKPVLVEEVSAHAGIDIGDTLIGMNMKRVAVPIRSSIKRIGQANLTMAKTRPRLIGGKRTIYTEEFKDVH